MEERIRKAPPMQKLWAVADVLLRSMDADFAAMYAKTGRESIPPERLLRALLKHLRPDENE